MWKIIYKNKYIIAFFFLLSAVLFVNAFHTSYPDEFDNILGGKLILEGILPYKGFFSHHGPLSYFLSSILVLFSGQSFVKFRILYAFFLLLFSIGTYLAIRSKYILLFFLGLAVASPYFWGNMILADNLSGILLVPAYAILFFKVYREEKLRLKDLLIMSISSSASLLNSMTYTYSVAILVLTASVYYIRSLKNAFQLGLIFGTPYAVFGLYLLITGSIKDFIFEAVDYNRKYYIYNYPRPEGSTSFNPIRYAVVVLNNFLNNFQIMATDIISFYPRYPLPHVLGFTNIFLWTWLLFRKKYLLFGFSFLLLAFSTARGNPADMKPTDYQIGVYLILSLLNAAILSFLYKNELHTLSSSWFKNIAVFSSISFSILWLFGSMYLGLEFWRINYDRYMGKMPLIYDRPVAAPMLNKIVPASHYCWVGPFDFEEMFYLDCRQPSKYHWILPQFSGLEPVKQQIISDYTKNMADVIVFNRTYSAFGVSSEYSRFFVDFLNQNYVRPSDLGYRFISPKQNDYNFDDAVNLNKTISAQLIEKLVSLGYIEKQSK